jgi:drug/metabolite transporter (DMT)-like permease
MALNNTAANLDLVERMTHALRDPIKVVNKSRFEKKMHILRLLLDPKGEEQRIVAGIACCIAALFLFSSLDATTKYLVHLYPIPMVAWVRYFAQFALMTAVLAPIMGRDLLRTTRTGLVLLRASCLASVSILLISAFSRLPLAEATSIMFVAPLLVILLARPMLKERIGAVRWVAVLAGFVGVLVIARPSGRLDTLGVAMVLLATVFNALYQLLSGVLRKTERAPSLLFYSALLGTVVFGLVMPWFWGGPSTTPFYYLLFIAMGVFGGVGHFLFTEAFHLAPASLLAPIMYLQLLISGFLGWWIFGQVPDRVTLIGMAIIAASGIAVAIYGRGQTGIDAGPIDDM